MSRSAHKIRVKCEADFPQESIEAKEGHSTKLSFSEEEKAEVIVSETFGVLLLQDPTKSDKGP